MNYITIDNDSKETLLAVAADEKIALNIIKEYDCGILAGALKVRTLNQLFDNKVEIPVGLAWIVESDRKHQQREVESRSQNICEPKSYSRCRI